ncbi:MAG: YceI family protein [Methylophaga sp.]|nr:YceI family protein [Methylophaga sp.]
MKKTAFASSMLLASSLFLPAQAAEYVIDTEKAHAFIDFRIQHLGFSWMSGRFNEFSGNFFWDADNPEASSIEVVINTNSIDTNFAERDRHLRSDDFLDVRRYPEARFVSTSVEVNEDGTMRMTGDFTLHGVTNPLVIEVEKVGEGTDPWGGYRAGFHGETSFTIADYGIDVTRLGPGSQEVYLVLSVEGIRQ